MELLPIERLTGDQVGPYVGRIVDLYATVYAEPPYEEGPEQVAEFAAKLPEEATRPGFTAAVSLDGDATVGTAYGWTMPAGVWWSRSDQPGPADLVDVDKFAVMEWIVHPSGRGAGVGGRLLHALLADRTEPWAVLASDPRSAARGIYERAGWRQIGTSTLPWGPTMDLLALRLED